MQVFLWTHQRQQKKIFRQKTLFSPWTISSFASHRLLWWRCQFNYSDATADICSHNIPCCFSEYCWFTMDSACWRPAFHRPFQFGSSWGQERGTEPCKWWASAHACVGRPVCHLREWSCAHACMPAHLLHNPVLNKPRPSSGLQLRCWGPLR